MPIELAKLSQPLGPIAFLQQSTENRACPRPAHFSSPDGAVKCKVLSGNQSMSSFQHILDAFVSAHGVEYGRTPDFVDNLLDAELAELKMHASKSSPLHGSLPARPLSLLLLLPGASSSNAKGRNALDAFAQLASGKGCNDTTPVAAVARCAVLAGVDADRLTDGQNLDEPCLLVRWLSTGHLISKRFELESVTDDMALQSIQNAVFRAKELFFAHTPDLIFQKRSNLCLSYEECLTEIHDLFFMRQYEVQCPDVSGLGLTLCKDQYARVCRRPDNFEGVREALNQPVAFHVLLLCANEHHEEVSRLCNGGLSLPGVCPEMEHLQIHTVGVNAETLFLGDAVSLFASSGSPGASLSGDGTPIWKFVTKCLPYLSYGADFLVQPCHASSVIPVEDGLIRYNTNFFEPAVTLVYNILAGVHRPETPPTRPVSRSGSFTAVEEKPSQEELWLSTAFGLNLSNSRATIGDAASNPSQSPELKECLKEMCLCFGIQTPLSVAFERMGAMLRERETHTIQFQEEISRWRDIAEGALKIPLSAPQTDKFQIVSMIALLHMVRLKVVRIISTKRQEVVVDKLRLFVEAPEDVTASVQRLSVNGFEFITAACALFWTKTIPLLRVDDKENVVEGFLVGRGSRLRTTLGNAIENAMKTKFLIVASNSRIFLCQRETKAQAQSRKEKEREAEQKKETSEQAAPSKKRTIPCSHLLPWEEGRLNLKKFRESEQKRKNKK